MNAYVTEREGVNYTVYVRTQVCSYVFAKNFLKKKQGTFDRGLLVRGGGGAIGQGADVRGGFVQ